MLLLLLLAACASGSPAGNDKADEFAAAESDPNATEPVAPKVNPDRPLSDDEQADAALLVNKLAEAKDEQTRDLAVNALVKLGPRYLAFLRSVRDDDIAMDLMRIVRRIERDAQVANDNPGPIKPNEITSNGGEGRKPPPEYADLPTDFDREQVERFLGARLTQARSLLDLGDNEGAVAVANAALLLLPDTRYRPEFDALVLKARNESQAELLIAGTMQLSPDHLQYESRAKGAKFADALKVKCYLKNVSAGEIRLTLYDGPGRESLLQLNVRYEQLDYAGNAMTQQGTVSVPIAAGAIATLLPNETHEIEIPLEALNTLDTDAPQKWALGRVTVDAALRVFAATDQTGKAIVLRPIRFAERSIFVFPHGFDLAAAEKNPVNTVRDMLKDGKSQEAFMASQVVKKSQLRAMADLLVADDFEGDNLANQRARLRSMATLFATGATWDITKWRRWWTQNRNRQ